jgi:hypothetical protein
MKRPEKSLKELGFPSTFIIQTKTLRVIEFILKKRLQEHFELTGYFKPSENDVVNEVLKRGIESILGTKEPIEGWQPDVYKTMKITRKKHAELLEKVVKPSVLTQNVSETFKGKSKVVLGLSSEDIEDDDIMGIPDVADEISEDPFNFGYEY